jgi:guanylate kinase
MPPAKGQLIVMCGPSGVGKSTLSLRMADELGVAYVPAVTTREPRPGDSKGKSYEHVSEEVFFERLDAGKFLEYAQNYDDYYATPKHPALDLLDDGRDVLLEIDVQGALQVRYHYPEALLIFVLPPTEKTLYDRLVERGRDEPRIIAKRYRAARREIHMAKGSRAFDAMLVNDDLEQAVSELKKLVRYRQGEHLGDVDAQTGPGLFDEPAT